MTKDGDEIDFLVTRDGQPWLPVEVRSGDSTPSPLWAKFARRLACTRGVQITATRERRRRIVQDNQIEARESKLLLQSCAEASRRLETVATPAAQAPVHHHTNIEIALAVCPVLRMAPEHVG
jgi:hypothetical protein